jgi:hypothetical protein
LAGKWGKLLVIYRSGWGVIGVKKTPNPPKGQGMINAKVKLVRASNGKRSVQATVLVVLLSGASMVTDAFSQQSSPIPAPSPEFSHEIDKAAAFQQASMKFTLENEVRQKEFCGSFIGDLHSLKNIQFVEPIIKASTYDDPVLSGYPLSGPTSGCDNMNQINTIDRDEQLSNEDLDTFREAYYALANIRIYRLKIGSEAERSKSGESLIFYGEEVCRKLNYQSCVYAFYRVVDQNSCQVHSADHFDVNDPYDYFERRKTPTINALVTYQGRARVLLYSEFVLEKKITSMISLRTLTPVNSPEKDLEGCLFQTDEEK